MRFVCLLLCSCAILRVAVAEVHHVPGDHATIQQALDAIADGDTILVAVDTYHEALVAPPLSFLLRGDVDATPGEYPRPIIDPSPLPGSDSLACLVLPPESHPIIEDLKFRNGPEMYPRRDWEDRGGIRSSSLDPVLRRCLIDSCFVGFKQEEEWDTQETLITLEKCWFRDDSVTCVESVWSRKEITNCLFEGRGTRLLRLLHNSRVSGCRFKNNDAGHFINGSGDNIVIEDCIFGPFDYFFPAVLLGLSGGSVRNNVFMDCESAWPLHIDANGPNQIEITGNIFRDNRPSGGSGGGGGMDMWYQPDAVPLVVPAIIRDNVFHNLLSNTLTTALNCNVPAVVSGNRFFNLEPSSTPAVSSTLLAGGDSVIYRDNLFWNTGWAMEGNWNTDARWNWWGDSTGPYHDSRNPGGLGDPVIGQLQFEPWYTDTMFTQDSEERPALPSAYSLAVYPNPFNSTAKLKLEVPEVAIVRIELFNTLGRRVREVFSGAVAYEKTVTFEAGDLPSGVYFARATDTIYNRPLISVKLVLMR